MLGTKPTNQADESLPKRTIDLAIDFRSWREGKPEWQQEKEGVGGRGQGVLLVGDVCSAWVVIVDGEAAGLYYISQVHASRTSVYKTIEEEISNTSSPARIGSNKSSPTTCQPVYIVDPEIASIMSVYSPPGAALWDDERKYYALKDEAQDTMTENSHQRSIAL